MMLIIIVTLMDINRLRVADPRKNVRVPLMRRPTVIRCATMMDALIVRWWATVAHSGAVDGVPEMHDECAAPHHKRQNVILRYAENRRQKIEHMKNLLL